MLRPACGHLYSLWKVMSSNWKLLLTWEAKATLELVTVVDMCGVEGAGMGTGGANRHRSDHRSLKNGDLMT